MKTFTTLSQIANDHDNFTADLFMRFHHYIYSAKNDFQDPEVGELMYSLGGHVHIVETADDFMTMIDDYGHLEQADLVANCLEDKRYIEAVYLNNNAGGPTFLIPVELYEMMTAKAKQEPKREAPTKVDDFPTTREYYHEVHQAVLDSLLQQRAVWLRINDFLHSKPELQNMLEAEGEEDGTYADQVLRTLEKLYENKQEWRNVAQTAIAALRKQVVGD